MNVGTLRSPNAEEVRLLEILFSVDFPGRRDLQEQAMRAEVRTIDGNGSLQFFVVNPTQANVKGRVPVSARLPDANGSDLFGICVNLLLHVRNGVLAELEIYKDDGSAIVMPFRFESAFVHAI